MTDDLYERWGTQPGRHMSTRKKILISVCAGFIAILVLVSIMAVTILTTIDINAATQNFVSELSEKFNGTITFDSVQLKIFPIPHLEMQKVNFGKTDQIDITIKRLSLHPRLSSLILGKMALSKLKMNTLTASIYFDGIIDENRSPEQGVSPSALKKQVDRWLIILADKLPGLTIDIRNGKIDLTDRKQHHFDLSQIYAIFKLPPEIISFNVTCRSSLWKHADLSGWLDTRSYRSAGRLDWVDLKLQNIPESLFPATTFSVFSFSSDLHLTYNAKNASEFSGEIHASFPDISFKNKDLKTVVINCDVLEGSFEITKNRTLVNLATFSTPFADLKGKFQADEIDPTVSLSIEGSIRDAAQAREVALFLAGKYRVTQKICDIIRSGSIPHFSFLDKADSVKGLKKVNNILIKGKMTDGAIIPPKSHLNLTEVSGDVVLSGGFLQGKNLKGRLGNSFGREGKFSIGMMGPEAPFHLETMVEADVSQIPPILKQFSKNEGLSREMELLKHTRGHAFGKLVLGDQKKQIKPKIEVYHFSFETDYDRIPLTLKLTGENFSYHDKRIDINTISGTVGQSALTDVAAMFNWYDIPLMSCRGRSLRVNAGEIYPWFMSLKGPGRIFADNREFNGLIDFSEPVVKGSLVST